MAKSKGRGEGDRCQGGTLAPYPEARAASQPRYLRRRLHCLTTLPTNNPSPILPLDTPA